MCLNCRRHGISDSLHRKIRCALGCALDVTQGRLATNLHTLLEAVARIEVVGCWRLGLGREIHVGFTREVKQRSGHLEPTDPVGDGVVNLDDERGATIGKAGDHVNFPQRPSPVEVLFADGLGEFEDLGESGVLPRNSLPPQVVREVEVLVCFPAGRQQREWVADRPLP